MKCPYIKPTIHQCNNCPFPDCIRSEGQDNCERAKAYYRAYPEKVKAYQKQYRKAIIHKERERDRRRYPGRKEYFEEWEEKNKEKRKIYFQERYQRKKAERVS